MPEPNIKVIANRQFLLNARDFLRGALYTVVTAILTSVYTSLDAGTFKIDWNAQKHIAIITFLGYLIKNWLEPNNTLIQVKKAGDISNIQVDLTKEKPTVTTSVG